MLWTKLQLASLQWLQGAKAAKGRPVSLPSEADCKNHSSPDFAVTTMASRFSVPELKTIEYLSKRCGGWTVLWRAVLDLPFETTQHEELFRDVYQQRLNLDKANHYQ
jgi:hypothetical protein